jgi:methionine aminopeptidase
MMIYCYVASRRLADGDIVNIDVTVYFNGYHGDTSQTFLVGNVVSNHASFRTLQPLIWK